VLFFALLCQWRTTATYDALTSHTAGYVRADTRYITNPGVGFFPLLQISILVRFPLEINLGFLVAPWPFVNKVASLFSAGKNCDITLVHLMV
jgi:hypothetical protein